MSFDWYYGDFDAGFLIVRAYSWLFDWYCGSEFCHDNMGSRIYAIPQRGFSAENYDKQYGGIDRIALTLEPNGAYPEIDELDALVMLEQLEQAGRAKGDFIFDAADAQRVYSAVQNRTQWDMIWAARTDRNSPEPAGGVLLGFEPSYFYLDHFSAIADCMCFPRWHGCDPEGTLFREYFERLNGHALFNTPREAEDYLDFYLSFPWTEHPREHYHITKVIAF